MAKIVLSRPTMMAAYTRLVEMMLPQIHFTGGRVFKIYGVPRGGIHVSWEVKSLLSRSYANVEVTYDIMEANVIVDDIIDSGKTKERIGMIKDVPFFALFDRRLFVKSKDVNLCEDRNSIMKSGLILDTDWLIFPWEVNPLNDAENSAEDIVIRQLQYIGEDPKREGLLDTPRRVVKAWGKFFEGYGMNPADILGRTFSKETYNQMVILKDIEFYSHCEHHLVPFYGRCHIAYIPGDKVVGISKLARLVECFARRLQIQERMTEEIASALEKYLSPVGVAVFVEAKHLCMTARGVEKQNSVMLTSALKGACVEEATRMEFLLLKGASTWNH